MVYIIFYKLSKFDKKIYKEGIMTTIIGARGLTVITLPLQGGCSRFESGRAHFTKKW